MKIISYFLLLLLLAGCSSSKLSSNEIDNDLSNEECEQESSLKLPKEEVKKIEFKDKLIEESGKVSDKKHEGYIFEAKKGQKLNYATQEDICIWVYTQDIELVDGTELPKDGKYTIQIAALKGLTTYNLEMSLETPNKNPESSQVSSSDTKSNQSDPSTSYSTQNTTSYQQVDLTQEQAVELVKAWYEAKPEIFGGSFDRSLVDRYATGKLYYETTQKDGGGSMGWLQNNGCYYTYPFSNIDKVWSYSTSGTRPFLKIQVSERLQLHGSSSAGCGNPAKSYQKNVSYWFEKENGIWKIYEYEVQ